MGRTVKAGDTVVLIEMNLRPRLVTIERVARKYVYLKERQRRGFSLETGQTNEPRGGAYIRTLEDHARIEAVAEAQRVLRSHGVTLDRQVWDRAVEIREALRPVLEAKQ